jgi:hypothetical protein
VTERERKIVGGADSPDVARDVIAATDKEIAGLREGWFGHLVGKAILALIAGFVVLALIAGFWGLWLAARTLLRAMGA